MNQPVQATGALLKHAREAKGWTQQQLADALKVDSQTVRSWERGRRFPLPLFRNRLCEVFDQTPEQLGLLVTGKQSSLEPAQPPPLLLLEQREQRVVQKGDGNKQKMISRVRSRWITGVLEHSLYQATLLELGLKEQPDALNNPWHLQVQESNLARTLPAGTTILHAYDQSGGELLILGEPGAGKTTLLLELARELLNRAELDAFFPLPVVFNLSSWSEKFHLIDWLVEELQTKYQVPLKVGREWINADQLLLLLDGLDEVDEALRSVCIDQINQYHKAHHLVPIVMCSREAEYLSQTKRMALQQAVLIQPLTPLQIDAYLSNIGHELHTVRDLLQDDPVLMDLVTTPLMLNILILTYHGRPAQELARLDSLEARRSQVFVAYTKRMLSRRGVETRYNPSQTIQWLEWLAQQLEHRKTEFFLEQLQPDWLHRTSYHRYIQMITRLIYGIHIIVGAAVFAWLRGGAQQGSVFGVGAGLLGTLGAGSGNTVLGWMAPGLGGGLAGGGSLGIIITIVNLLATLLFSIGEIPRLSLRAVWRGLSTGISNGFLIALFFGGFSSCIYSFSHWPGNSVARGIGTGLFCGLLTGLTTGLIAGLRYEQDTKKELRLKRKIFVRDRLLNGAIFTLCGGLGFGVVDFLENGLKAELIIYGVIVGIFYGLLFSLGATDDLISDLGTKIKPAEAVAWSWKNVGSTLLENVRKGLILGSAVMIPVSMVIGAASGLFYGFRYGLHYGLVYGLIIGMIIGLAAILAGILDSGWSSTILEARERFRPNEGIRRSLANALFAAFLFGPLAGILSSIVCSLAFGMIGGLAGWSILGKGFGIVIGIIFAIQFLLLHGGIAYLEHYVLRWLLWRAGYMPWNYANFLDFAAERILLRKVGGGYIFVHRLLLTYLATWKV